jgi:hypothetical protein
MYVLYLCACTCVPVCLCACVPAASCPASRLASDERKLLGGPGASLASFAAPAPPLLHVLNPSISLLVGCRLMFPGAYYPIPLRCAFDACRGQMTLWRMSCASSALDLRGRARRHRPPNVHLPLLPRRRRDLAGCYQLSVEPSIFPTTSCPAVNCCAEREKCVQTILRCHQTYQRSGEDGASMWAICGGS